MLADRIVAKRTMPVRPPTKPQADYGKQRLERVTLEDNPPLPIAYAKHEHSINP